LGPVTLRYAHCCQVRTRHSASSAAAQPCPLYEFLLSVINIVTEFLDIIYRLVIYSEHNFSETGFCLRLREKAQLGPIGTPGTPRTTSASYVAGPGLGCACGGIGSSRQMLGYYLEIDHDHFHILPNSSFVAAPDVI
jgi:hypothetical protein